MFSGEDVGPLKWKATLTPAMTKRDEQHSGAADRLHDNATVFSDTIDLEVPQPISGIEFFYFWVLYVFGC